MSVLSELFQLHVLLPWLLGMLFGIFVGATPGLTATMAVALIVPVSFYMPDPNTGLAMIIGVSFTAIFAGDIPATYLRIPGTPASAAATLDGHQLAKQGRGRFALLIDLFCSSIGGLVGVTLLILIAPQLARFALKFSNFEYFWLAIFGLSMSAVVSSGNTRRGLLAAAFGMLLATIGLDVVSGAQRFTFSNPELMGGLGFIPVMIGLFGVSEVIRSVLSGFKAEDSNTTNSDKGDSALHSLVAIWKHKFTVIKSSMAGTIIGALPGAGADIAAWAAYGLEQRTSKKGANFGKGEVAGVVAPTSANNAAVSGAWIPALVFGIPGDAVTAIVLGALMMYEIKPGPLIFEQNPEQINAIFLIALITQLLLIPCGYLGLKTFGWLLKLPRSMIMVAVLVFSVVGSFSLRNSIFDVYVMAIFGLVGYFLEAKRVPLAPLILGLILGPMVEENFRTGLIKSEGSLLPFLNRPICAFLVLLLIVAFISPLLLKRIRRKPAKLV
ncbi:MAG: tripartite tricarboxylate transporter permease [Opitutales bacterium]|jgi:TctA family transporter|nr:tripartite tricarboxylate transporter permease [Opitutales bacterium]